MVILWDFETTQEGEGENVSDLIGEQSVVYKSNIVGT